MLRIFLSDPENIRLIVAVHLYLRTLGTCQHVYDIFCRKPLVQSPDDTKDLNDTVLALHPFAGIQTIVAVLTVFVGVCFPKIIHKDFASANPRLCK